MKKNSKNKVINNIKIIYIAIAKIIFTVSMFVLAQVDNNGCDCFMGGFCPNCLTFNYMIAGYISIPSTVLSLVGSLGNDASPSIIGSAIFLIINIVLLFMTTITKKIMFEILCITFFGILLFIEIQALKNIT